MQGSTYATEEAQGDQPASVRSTMRYLPSSDDGNPSNAPPYPGRLGIDIKEPGSPVPAYHPHSNPSSPSSPLSLSSSALAPEQASLAGSPAPRLTSLFDSPTVSRTASSTDATSEKGKRLEVESAPPPPSPSSATTLDGHHSGQADDSTVDTGAAPTYQDDDYGQYEVQREKETRKKLPVPPAAPSIPSSSERPTSLFTSDGSSNLERRRTRGPRPMEASEESVAAMSPAERAQHHFRLAQQHLEAAQRLAMGASMQMRPQAPAHPFSSPTEVDARRIEDRPYAHMDDRAPLRLATQQNETPGYRYQPASTPCNFTYNPDNTSDRFEPTMESAQSETALSRVTSIASSVSSRRLERSPSIAASFVTSMYDEEHTSQYAESIFPDSVSSHPGQPRAATIQPYRSTSSLNSRRNEHTTAENPFEPVLSSGTDQVPTASTDISDSASRTWSALDLPHPSTFEPQFEPVPAYRYSPQPIMEPYVPAQYQGPAAPAQTTLQRSATSARSMRRPPPEAPVLQQRSQSFTPGQPFREPASFILSSSGQPIAVYAAPPSIPARYRPTPPAPQQQLQHPYHGLYPGQSHFTAPAPPQPAPPPPSSSIFRPSLNTRQSNSSSPVSPYISSSSHNLHRAPSSQSTHSSTSATSSSRKGELNSGGEDDTSSLFSVQTGSRSMRNRMASLRDKLTSSPHVRFQSPDRAPLITPARAAAGRENARDGVTTGGATPRGRDDAVAAMNRTFQMLL